MKSKSFLAVLAACALLAAPAGADWDPGDGFKMHYPQEPDISSGYDVLASLTDDASVKFLADDWLCTSTGPVADIHIWGSWLDDIMPPVPDHGTFILGIYDDLPIGDGSIPYSRPGNLLWQMQFRPGEYVARYYSDAFDEQFYDVNIGQILGFDNGVWQYNFFIDPLDAFRQEEGNIYWLAVGNVDPDNDGFINTLDLASVFAGQNRFGWKTTNQPFNDTAVYLDSASVLNTPVDLIGPPGGAPSPGLPWEPILLPWGTPLDLAFVITPEPASIMLAFLGVVSCLVHGKRRL
jgi:hypothetical protein